MGIIHIPRVIASCARGYYRRHGIIGSSTSTKDKPSLSGAGLSEPHTYKSRVGIFDIDGFGHMNHSAYLAQAEFARWEMSAMNGSLEANIRSKTAFVVTGAAVRYRREIGPLFRQFEIQSIIGSADERNLWIYHTFRYPGEENRESKILAQLLIQAALVKNRKVVEPRLFMEEFGLDPDTVDRLHDSNNEGHMQKKLSTFQELERAMRASAADDDKRINGLLDEKKSG
mmetsp:Transcript_38491/g.57690  ORF Transcript_38491/g.57690 Transcript_38491/m.57690 type:complete len:228 (-) Transcript_38491:497-1180(-)